MKQISDSLRVILLLAGMIGFLELIMFLLCFDLAAIIKGVIGWLTNCAY